MKQDIEQTKKVNEAKRVLVGMQGNFIGRIQASAIKQILNSLDIASAVDMADRILGVWETIKTMPVTYETSTKAMKDVTVQLHYFRGNVDVWVTEKDKGLLGEWTPLTPQVQAFGLVCMGDADLGYVSLREVVDAELELDLHWTKTDLESVSKEAHKRGYK